MKQHSFSLYKFCNFYQKMTHSQVSSIIPIKCSLPSQHHPSTWFTL